LFAGQRFLASETVQSAALAFEGIHDVHGSHCLAASMLSVGHCITDDVLQESLEDSSGLFVDGVADTLDTTTASQSANSRLGNSLDVISEDLPVPLGASFAESLASFTTSLLLIAQPHIN